MAAVVETFANFQASADFRCILEEILEFCGSVGPFFKKQMVFLAIVCPDSVDGDDTTDYQCLARPC